MGNPILRAVIFFARRLLGNLGSLLVVVTLLFVLFQASPGGPFDTSRLSPEVQDRLRQQYRLDQPLPVQYANFMGRVLTGDYGASVTMQGPVNELVERYAPNTLRLWRLAILLSLAPGSIILGLGLLALWLRGRAPLLGNGLRRLGQVIASGWLLVPVLVTGVALWAILAVGTHTFPMAGMYDPRVGESLEQVLQHAFLPALSLALLPAYLVARSVAGEFAHYADKRNVSAPEFAAHAICRLPTDGLIQGIGILGGLVVIEALFSWPGIGRLLYDAVLRRDIPLLLGTTMTILWGALILRVLSDAFRSISLGFSAWLDGEAEMVEPKPASTLNKALGIAWVILAVLLVLMPVFVALGGVSFAPYDPIATSIGRPMLPPGGDYVLGTDRLGRDILSRLLYAMRLDLGLAILMALVALVPAALLGLLAGFLARRRTVWADLLDGLVMFPAEALVALPGLVLLVVASSTWLAMSKDAPVSWLPMAVFVAVLYVLPRMMHLLREGTATIPTQGGPGRTVLRLVGMASAVLLVAPTLGLFALSTLGFLGLGVQPPDATLGNMIQDSIQFAARTEGVPWTIMIPAFAIVFLSGGWFLLAGTVLSKAGVHRREGWLDVNR